MSQNLQNFVKFQKFQLENLVDFEKCCKTHILLQKSEPIQPKTSNILPKYCQPTLSCGCSVSCFRGASSSFSSSLANIVRILPTRLFSMVTRHGVEASEGRHVTDEVGCRAADEVTRSGRRQASRVRCSSLGGRRSLNITFAAVG